MKRTVYVALGIFLFGMIARWVVFHFVRIPWIIYDEYIYLDGARQILRGEFISHLFRDQSYPPGWSFVLAPVVGLFHDPFLQYRAALLLVMALSSLVGVMAYLFTASSAIGVLTSLFPPLFLYSGSIMSETVYTLFLFFLLFCLRIFIKEDLKTVKNAILSGVIVTTLIVFMQEIRSFGRTLFPAFALSMASIYVLRYKEPREWIKKYGYFIVAAVIAYVLFSYVSRTFLHATLYETEGYMSSLKHIATPLSLKLILNQFAAIGIELYGVLGLAFLWGSYRAYRKNDTPEIIARVFVWFVFLSSFALTLLHMLKTAQHDKQYWIFTRYLDPTIVLMFVYGLKDGLVFLREKKHALYVWVLPLFLFVLYVWKYLYIESYKFGNTMSIFFLADKKDTATTLYVLPLVVFLLALFVLLRIRKHNLIVVTFVLFFSWQWHVSIPPAIAVPKYVIARYDNQIVEWQRYFANNSQYTPLCRYESNASAEVYYIYSFLQPYQYIHTCKSYSLKKRPKHILMRVPNVPKLSWQCEEEFTFDKDDTMYYCPYGY
ncbi:hypothetical protein COU88_02280 [Candidatus Roizmanbacteria bacterium CG10_big_fil_rev_8_21_14_0_10_39_6]|uniref:Glycosyltransferase RgtA/B/C/D-like domain-containing protein n=1 Tax=Candidatus Roizmanbacteria bacterium CG10_big_fil_rev_8_21_14_0_10_39_6 TaxID=1974853 RepID=A0A2M8KSQ3_9BACT|nr:MAG: hypothetical protein COU88_02280 [Candidatus Roizmanbacteria bacterium CG10_big_fil_rev_8_21_14_0_10_39_6]